MKRILMFLFLPLQLLATNYCIDNTFDGNGNDANPGTILLPWKTMAKANSFTFAGGDIIQLKGGGTYYGSLVFNRAFISVTSYGSGKAIVSGFTTVSGWVNLGSGVWQSSALANVKNKVNLVTLNGGPVEVGRTPNVDDGSGYITYSAFSGQTVTAAALSGSNWVGGELLMVKAAYLKHRLRITGQAGAVLTYVSATATINPMSNGSAVPANFTPDGAGAGLFVQRHRNTLDKFSEWYFDSTNKKLDMFFGTASPADYVVKIASVDTLLNINSRNNVNISNLIFEGAGMASIFASDASNISIINCQGLNSGAKGIFLWNTSNVTVLDNDFDNSMCNGIDISARHAGNYVIRGNWVNNTGAFAGMGSFFDNADHKAMYIHCDSLALVSHNRIENTAYSAIDFQGNSVHVDSNFIDNYCNICDDGGGIYTAGQNDLTRYGRTIQGNVILHAGDARKGSNKPAHAEGTYVDQNGAGIDIIGNVIGWANKKGIHLNDPYNVNVSNNLCYLSSTWARSKHTANTSGNFMMHYNSFFTIGDIVSYVHVNEDLSSAYEPVSSTGNQSLHNIGTVDYNRYNFTTSKNYGWYYAVTLGAAYVFMQPGDFVNFSQWKDSSGLDLHSAVTNISTGHRLEYNASDVAVTVRFDGFKRKDYVTGTSYSDFVEIPAWQGKIMYDDGLSDGGGGPTDPPVIDSTNKPQRLRMKVIF